MRRATFTPGTRNTYYPQNHDQNVATSQRHCFRTYMQHTFREILGCNHERLDGISAFKAHDRWRKAGPTVMVSVQALDECLHACRCAQTLVEASFITKVEQSRGDQHVSGGENGENTFFRHRPALPLSNGI